jgi:branched-chain amino acid transport system ATP-binding protein
MPISDPLSSLSASPPAALVVDSVSVRYGGIEALDSLSLCIGSGQLAALIGPNGAGKSTLFHAVAAAVPLAKGDIRIMGRSTKGRPMHEMAGLGLARMSQHASLFHRLSVSDHLKLATHPLRAQRKPVQPPDDWRSAVVDALDLNPVLHRTAESLPMALQRRVELARCMVAQPGLLLLDEPATGQTQADWAGMVQALNLLRQNLGTATLIIEHRLQWVWPLCEVCWVLDQGRLIAHGTPEQVRTHPAVVEAYLGGAWHEGA